MRYWACFWILVSFDVFGILRLFLDYFQIICTILAVIRYVILTLILVMLIL